MGLFGMNGHIAQRYGELLKDMWSGSAKFKAPIKLRVMGRGGGGGGGGLFCMKGHIA